MRSFTRGARALLGQEPFIVLYVLVAYNISTMFQVSLADGLKRTVAYFRGMLAENKGKHLTIQKGAVTEGFSPG